MKKLIALLLALSMLAALAGCTPKASTDANKPAPEPVALDQALQNTKAAITQGKSFTVTVSGLITNYSEVESHLYYGMENTISGEIKLYLDEQNEQLSMYGQAVSDGEMVTSVLHDGWAVIYDLNEEKYFKQDISEEMEELFSEDGLAPEALLTEEELEDLEETVDPEELPALWDSFAAEKLSDETWLRDTCGYTCATEGTTATHSFQAELRPLLTEVAAHFEEAFTEDGYEDLSRAIKRIDKEMTLQLTLTQENDMITSVALQLQQPEDDITNETRLSVSISDIGTTELDLDMLDQILEDLDEYNDAGNYLGTIDGQSYVNKSVGLAAEFGKDWVVATPEEAAELVGMSGDLVGLENSLEEYGIVCDLYAVYSDGRSTINIMVEENNFMTRNMSEEEYMQTGLESIKYSLESAGLSKVKTELGTMTFAGQEHITLEVSGSMYGTTVYETVVIIRTDDYIYTITAACHNTDRTEEFLSIFTQA